MSEQISLGLRRAGIRSFVALFVVTILFAGFPPRIAGAADGLSVVAAAPVGAGASRHAQIDVTFSAPVDPTTVAGSIDGSPIVPTEVAMRDGDTRALIDPGELEYGRTYDVIIAADTQAAGGGTLGDDYTFAFTVEPNPGSKRPGTTVTTPAGPFTAGQPYTISGQATGSVWERDANNPLELRHWNANGVDTGDSPMLHPTALYFPQGVDGYKFYLYYTPYPGETDENPVLMRSNDGVHFDATGVTNPLFTYGMQPPFDTQNLADPEVYKVGDTWMLFYEQESNAVGEKSG